MHIEVEELMFDTASELEFAIEAFMFSIDVEIEAWTGIITDMHTCWHVGRARRIHTQVCYSSHEAAFVDVWP